MKLMKYEMERLKQQQELDDFREDLERKKNAKKAEADHAEWLEEQKRKIQALKVQQAVVAEEAKLAAEKLRNEPAAKANNEPATNAVSDALPKTDAVPAATLARFSGYAVVIDGFETLPSDLKGDSFRIAVGFFDNAGFTMCCFVLVVGFTFFSL